MKIFYSKLSEKVQIELEAIDLEGCDISIEESIAMIRFLEKCMQELRTHFLALDVISVQDEIFFFKEAKPEVLGFLLYFNKIHTIELKCPNGSNETLKEYFQKELYSLTYFFERNLNFYQYYRSRSTHLDEFYFTRHKPFHQLCLDSVQFVIDNEFSTGYDYKVAKIICNEMLRIYLNKRMNGLDKQQYIEKKRASLPFGNLKWTGPKVALVEYGYGLDTSTYVNNGNADIKEIMIALEIVFNVDLGDYYRTYYSIKVRDERTKYLNIMIDRLKKRIDEEDSK